MLLLKGARVMDPCSGRDEAADILIEDGLIQRIGKDIEPGGINRVIDGRGLIVSPGFIDVHVHFREPGFGYKEDISTGALAAAAGGYTTVVCMANTKPPVDHPEAVAYVLDKGRKTSIQVLTVGCVTRYMEGQELTKMEALKESGVVGFSDDGRPLTDAALVRAAMEQAKALGVPISLHEEDPRYVAEAGINSGQIARSMGLTGASDTAEESLVRRDIMLALETGADINIQHISSKKAVELVREGKKRGRNIHAEATPHHFSLTEEAVLLHQGMAKMNPPLRTEEDRQAIIEGLKDGTIDLIATDHAPHSRDEKEGDFVKAMSGIIGLETALALGITNLVRPGRLTLMELLEKMTLNPAGLYHLDRGCIREGGAADLAVFALEEQFSVGAFHSRSANTPFTGQRLYGRVKYTIAGGRVVYEEDGGSQG